MNNKSYIKEFEEGNVVLFRSVCLLFVPKEKEVG